MAVRFSRETPVRPTGPLDPEGFAYNVQSSAPCSRDHDFDPKRIPRRRRPRTGNIWRGLHLCESGETVREEEITPHGDPRRTTEVSRGSSPALETGSPQCGPHPRSEALRSTTLVCDAALPGVAGGPTSLVPWERFGDQQGLSRSSTAWSTLIAKGLSTAT